jgi:hypothetical protein
MAGVIGVVGGLPAWLPALMASPAILFAQHQSRTHTRDVERDSSSMMDRDIDSSDDDTDTDDHDVSVTVGDKDDRHTADIARMLRPARDASVPFRVQVTYGAGTLSLAPANGPWLYDVRSDYATANDAPVVSFDSASHMLRVGGRHGDGAVSVTLGDHSSKHDNDLTVALARAVPLDLELNFGGGDVTAQLGGLSVQRLKVSTGASDARLSFNTPNPVPLEQLVVQAGAAGFRATGLGNAQARHVRVDAGAGDVDLDFGGRWTGDATLNITAAIGSVEVHVPQGVVVDVVTRKTFIGSTDDNTGATTPQVPGGPLYHLHVTSTTALGSLDFDRKTRN